MFRQLLEYTASNSKVYHIRGTATDNFDFTLKYIDDNDNITTVTEHAIIDGNGKWNISYSNKKIYGLAGTFYNKLEIKTIEFTEKLSELIELNDTNNYTYIGAFHQSTNITSIKFAKGTKFDKVTRAYNTFRRLYALQELNLKDATFENCTNSGSFIGNCTSLVTLDISSWNGDFVDSSISECTALTNLYVPNNGTFNNAISFKDNPLSYDSMLRVAGWLKNLTGLTAKTVTFKADTYNALTQEQKDTLYNIIHTQKNWTLATA